MVRQRKFGSPGVDWAIEIEMKGCKCGIVFAVRSNPACAIAAGCHALQTFDNNAALRRPHS